MTNSIRLMAPHGSTWEEYDRRKWGVGVTRWHGWFDGRVTKAWTKILSREEATIRWKHLKGKGWRERRSETPLRTRANPVRGEWWIDDSGTALYADGDVGDMGHEAYVIDSLTRRLLDEMGIDVDDQAGVIDDWSDNIASVIREEEGEFDGDVDPFIEKVAAKIWKDASQRKDAVLIAHGGGDARKYGMQYDGWKRVQGHNIETWTLTTQDLKAITNGLYDAAGGDEIDDDETFNIYVFSTGMWYQEVPWSVLSEDDPGKLRIYGTKDNPKRKNPDDYEMSEEMMRAIREEGFRVWQETLGGSSADWKLLGTEDIVAVITIPAKRVREETAWRLHAWKGAVNGGETPVVQWVLVRAEFADRKYPGSNRTIIAGSGLLFLEESYAQVKSAFVTKGLRGQGIYGFVLKSLRKLIGLPIMSDVTRTPAADAAWNRLFRETDRVTFKGAVWKFNPMRKHYDFSKGFPVITYAAAHKWEPLAKAQGVSEVARSSRGFMRAYEKAGAWAALDPWWKARRNAFVARHMAQVRQNGEKLWKRDKSGNLRPSRRCLALIMWAYMPARKA